MGAVEMFKSIIAGMEQGQGYTRIHPWDLRFLSHPST